jgi:hypothetical protein
LIQPHPTSKKKKTIMAAITSIRAATPNLRRRKTGCRQL